MRPDRSRTRPALRRIAPSRTRTVAEKSNPLPLVRSPTEWFEIILAPTAECSRAIVFHMVNYVVIATEPLAAGDVDAASHTRESELTMALIEREMSLPLLTFEEFLTSSNLELRAEWVDGRLEMLMPVSLAHLTITRLLIVVLDYFLNLHRLGVLIHAPFSISEVNMWTDGQTGWRLSSWMGTATRQQT